MSIRIIDSCALSIAMVTGKGAETRVLTDNSTKWKEVSKYCIDNKLYLIVTPCVNDGYNKANIPSDENWKKLIHDTCKYLQSIGAKDYNCKISLINEPTKWFRDSGGGVVRLAHFINLAYPIIKEFKLRVGAGNMEFYDAAVLGDWYRYICVNAHFDDLDIHIQASCDTEEKIKKYTDYGKGLCDLYIKNPDCTEAFYGKIATSTGWNLINRQLYHAERIGCPNFANVFNNLDTSVFPILVDPKVLARWSELAFNINGVEKSKYWTQWKDLMGSKAPVPNIKEEIIMYKRPEQLQLFYDEVGWVRPYNENLPNLPIVGRKNSNQNITWSDLDAVMESLLKALFPDKNYPNIKYDNNGNWIANWLTYAKSGGVIDED